VPTKYVPLREHPSDNAISNKFMSKPVFAQVFDRKKIKGIQIKMEEGKLSLF
jgi:hypothetical protein